MSILYIRLPAKTSVEGAEYGGGLVCRFALAAEGGAILREGHSALSELEAIIRAAQRVVLLLAASDVTLFHIKVPPLSAARLKAALPNLIEDQLVSDPAECIVIAGATHGGLRTVGVVQRAWVELLIQVFGKLGAQHLSALPSQLCLPSQPSSVVAAVDHTDTELNLTLRLSEQAGMGLSILPEHPGLAIQECLQILNTMAYGASIVLYVPQTNLQDYRHVLDSNVLDGLASRIALHIDQWAHWIAGAKSVSLNLMSGMSAGNKQNSSWRSWRWNFALLGALIAAIVGGLDIEWWRLKHEATTLQTAMIQTYKSAYPNETIIVDPIAQIRQKIALAQREGGQTVSGDFIALVAAFGEAWSNLPKNAPIPAITGLEYKDRSLTVKLKTSDANAFNSLQTALAAHNLTLTEKPAGVLQLRSKK